MHLRFLLFSISHVITLACETHKNPSTCVHGMAACIDRKQARVTHTHTHTHTQMHIHARMHTQTHTNTHNDTQARTQIQAHIRTRAHTKRQMRAQIVIALTLQPRSPLTSPCRAFTKFSFRCLPGCHACSKLMHSPTHHPRRAVPALHQPGCRWSAKRAGAALRQRSLAPLCRKGPCGCWGRHRHLLPGHSQSPFTATPTCLA